MLCQQPVQDVASRIATAGSSPVPKIQAQPVERPSIRRRRQIILALGVPENPGPDAREIVGVEMQVLAGARRWLKNDGQVPAVGRGRRLHRFESGPPSHPLDRLPIEIVEMCEMETMIRMNA